MGKKLNLLNQKFGMLTVIEETPERKRGQVVWLCKCDCGQITKVPTGQLTSGNTKSCGCQKKKGLINYNKQQSEKAKIKSGTKFGKLTVIKDIGYKEQVPGHKRLWYLCQCDCGNQKEVMGNNLKFGFVSSCGKCRFSSKGEFIISQILKENNIKFEHDIYLEEFYKEVNRRLRFDFIIYNNDNSINRIIEFDGEQHIRGMQGGNWSNLESYEIISERDHLKNKYCFEHNIPLIRIPYHKMKTLTIEDIMSNTYRIIQGGDKNDAQN